MIKEIKKEIYEYINNSIVSVIIGVFVIYIILIN